MKTFLISVVTLAYMGGIISTAFFAMDGYLHIEMIISNIALIIFNIICSRYLYKKAHENKVEWALLGSIGNITAILCFWCFKDALNNWKRGKRNFS